jgi:HK97 family phage portal protein
MARAADDLEDAVRKAAREKRQALVLPAGLTVKTIGTDAEKAQLIETQRFLIEQVARIYNLPPVFLQDLSHGTFANVEQQDLHLVKHTLRHWVKQWEGELNLKLFGRLNRRQFVRVNLDGILRGDFKTRTEGYAAAIQHGVMTPDEARALEGRAPMPGGDQLYLQGAMVPIQQAGQPPRAGAQPNGGTDE